MSYFRSDFLPMSGCKRRLLWLWLGLAGLVMLLLLIRSVGGAYCAGLCEGDNIHRGRVWNWFLPNFMPTLTLMIGVFVADDIQRRKKAEEGEAAANEVLASGFLFRLSFAFSTIHLMTLVFMIIYQGVINPAPSMLDVIDGFGYFIVPFQGLVTATLGAFFTR